MIVCLICFRLERPSYSAFKNALYPYLRVKPTFSLWYAELKEPQVDILLVKNMNFPGIVSLKSSICVFDLINSYLSSCKAFWSLTAFEVKVLSFAMVAIETHCLKPKRLFILDKIFHVPFTMSLNHGKVQIFFLGKTTQMSLRSQILQ